MTGRHRPRFYPVGDPGGPVDVDCTCGWEQLGAGDLYEATAAHNNHLTLAADLLGLTADPPPEPDRRFCDCGHGHPWPCTCNDCTPPQEPT